MTDLAPPASGTGPAPQGAEPASPSQAKPLVPDALQAVYDLIIVLCEHDSKWRKPGARALRTVNALADENQGLRIAFWNFMRNSGLSQDTALAAIRKAAQGIEAQSAKTEGLGPQDESPVT